MDKDGTVLLEVELRQQEDGDWRLAYSIRNYSASNLTLSPTCDGLVRLAGRQREPVPCNPQAPITLKRGQTYRAEERIPTNEVKNPSRASLEYSYQERPVARTIAVTLQAPPEPLPKPEEWKFRPVDLSEVDRVVARIHPSARVQPIEKNPERQVELRGEQAKRLAKALAKAPPIDPRQPRPAIYLVPSLHLTMYAGDRQVAEASARPGVRIASDNAEREMTPELTTLLDELHATLMNRPPISYWKQHEEALKDTALAFANALAKYDTKAMKSIVRADLREQVEERFDWRHKKFGSPRCKAVSSSGETINTGNCPRSTFSFAPKTRRSRASSNSLWYP